MQTVIYRERVVPAVSVFFIGPILGLGVYAVFLALNDSLATFFGVGTALVIVLALIRSSPAIEIDDKTLKVKDARIPLDYVGVACLVTAEESFAAKGSNLDARAFSAFQAGVKTLVKVEITDPKDPTPYWIFATRKPEAVVKALRAKN